MLLLINRINPIQSSAYPFMSEVIVYISIGSNIDPDVYIPKAAEMLHNHPDLSDLKISSFFVSKALGLPEQPDYRNGVARFSTTLEPKSLKTDVLRKIEFDCGRRRTADRHAPRTIDLDIVLYGDRIIRSNDMNIPDSAIWERDFVTIPLLELAPELIIPSVNRTVADLAANSRLNTLKKDDSLNSHLSEGKYNG
jgi:2-amino-4-hydroxy-6-hydroxymethyldihydropteridine diphosphokinase